MSAELENWRERLDDLAGDLKAATRVLRTTKAEFIEFDADYYAAQEAQQTIQAVAETIQETAHAKIAGVVSRCLTLVFDEPYEFKIKFERARGRTEARLVFVRDGMEVNPIDSSGGGVVDVAAFALRLSCLMLSRPAARRTIVLDEPFRFVSRDYRPRIAAMLEGLARDFSVQFIMVTHIEELQCGDIVEVGA